MQDEKFKLSHLLLGIAGLLIIEAGLIKFFPVIGANEVLILLFAIVGAGMNIYVAVKAIEKVKSRVHVLVFLSLIVLEFIIFFAFEYWFLLLVQPASFPMLTTDVLSLLLHSTMVFVFNPLYLPATAVGRALMLVNTLSALGLVLFILQNIWQLHAHVGEPL
ncbi:MAG TPA: hypothetical protein VGO21_05825 [Candidatus Paceibacterota bacterium]|jgi:hypothetical protein|nr:hypothetical protein [Candidatus Paceibacterota bacterium]